MNALGTSSIYLHFPVLIVTVSLVYSGTRFEKWNQILREALFWGARMTAFLVGIGIALHLATVLEWWIWLAAIGGVMAVFLIVSLMSRNKTASSEHEWSP